MLSTLAAILLGRLIHHFLCYPRTELFSKLEGKAGVPKMYQRVSLVQHEQFY